MAGGVGGVPNPLAAQSNQPKTAKNVGGNVFDMNSFLQLLAVQLQNQDMMNPMKENEFMAQMAQMATVQAMNTFTDVAVTTYAASLLGKEVTVAEIDSAGKLTEISGTVTGAGLYNGQQVIFVNDKPYSLSQIMVIGKMPPKEEVPPEEIVPPGEGDGEKPPEEGEKPPEEGEKPAV